MKFKFTNFRLNAIAIFMFAMSMAISAQSTTCPEGMVSYWKLDDVKNATSYVDAISAHDATVDVAPDSIGGIIGSARNFNGTTQSLTVPSHTDYDFPISTSFSIELWTKHTDVSFGDKNKVMIGRGDPAYNVGQWWLGAEHSTGNITFSLKADTEKDAYFVKGKSCKDGNWHHIVAIKDTNAIKIYIDGKLDATSYVKFLNSFQSPGDIKIGNLVKTASPTNINYWYKGSLDDIAIYSRALSLAEVNDHYTKGLFGKNYCEGDQPNIISEPITSASVGQLYTYSIDATGTEPLTYTLLVKPNGMTISSEGLIEWTPASTSDNGLVKVMVSNPSFPPADTQTFVINIAEPAVCTEGLLGLWKMDEKSGSILADLYGNHALIVTPPSPATGIINGAQTFSATSEVNIPDDGTFEWSKEDNFSIEVWIKTNDASTNNLVALGRRDGSLATWWLGVNNKKAYFYIKDNDGIYAEITGTSSLINEGYWHQLVAVYDGSTSPSNINLYVDGYKYGTTKTFTGNFTKNSGLVPVTIGWYNATSNKYPFIGSIDEIALFNRALPESEIKTIYNNKKPEGHCQPGNYAPAFTSNPLTKAMATLEYKYTVTAKDVNEDALIYAAPTLPSWLTFDATTQILQGTPTEDNIGDHNVTITVTDGTATVSQNFTITVRAYSTVPEITNQSYLSTGMNTPIELKVADFTIMDPDTKPENMTLVVLEGTNYTFSGTTVTPATDFTGNLNVNVQVNDGASNSITFPALIVVGSVSVGVVGETKIKVYPNPASEYIVFDLDEISSSAKVMIYSIQGKLITSQELNVSTEVNLNGFSKGTYFYTIKSEEVCINGSFIKY